MEKIRVFCEGLDLEEELKDYILFLEENRKSKKTILNYSLWIESFINFVRSKTKDAGGEVISEGTNIPRIRLASTRYQKYLQKKGQKNITINLKTIALNGFLKFLDITEENKRGKNVTVQISLLETEVKHSIEDDRLMELDDFMKLLHSAKEKDDKRAIALFQFLFNTGARISEALSVDIERIEKAGNSYKVAIVGKRGKPRYIDFDKDTFQAVKGYLIRTGRTFQDKGALFISSKETDGEYRRMVPSTADYIIKQYAKDTSLPVSKFFAHNFRHLIAKTLLDEGASLDKIKNFLGHSNISTTSLYTMGKSSELRDLKDNAIKSAKERLMMKKYGEYEEILNHLMRNPNLSDVKLTALMKMSKSTFARKFSAITKEMRKDLKK